MSHGQDSAAEILDPSPALQARRARFGPESALSGPTGPRVCGETAITGLRSLGVQSGLRPCFSSRWGWAPVFLWLALRFPCTFSCRTRRARFGPPGRSSAVLAVGARSSQSLNAPKLSLGAEECHWCAFWASVQQSAGVAASEAAPVDGDIDSDSWEPPPRRTTKVPSGWSTTGSILTAGIQGPGPTLHAGRVLQARRAERGFSCPPGPLRAPFAARDRGPVC